MDSENKISTIIINRNTKSLLKQCLDSLPQGFGKIPYDVWVVDNASDDGSQEMVAKHYPHVHLIRNKENLGFARANNQALRNIKTPFALLLNSDTVLPNDSIVPLYDFLEEHPKAALVGPKLLEADGKLQPSTYPLPSLGTNFLMRSKFHKLLSREMRANVLLGSHWDHNQPRRVGRITGACILLRMKDIEPLNFLDEDFFFYGEVHDLCWRLWKNGREVWFNPTSFIYHLGGQTSKKVWDYKEKRRRVWRENERLLRKHQSPNYARMNILLNWLGFLLTRIKDTAVRSSNHASIDRDLLAVDLDWHSARLKEMLWHRFKHFFHTFYRLPFYTTRFQKMLIKEVSGEPAKPLEFRLETDQIQNELSEKWNNAWSDSRTGFMDFSCSALLYHIIRWLKPDIVVETGVANGVTSTVILSAMEANNKGKLYSIDWPGTEDLTFVPAGKQTGWMVPEHLRRRWTLEIGRSEEKLVPRLEELEEIDIFLHDSDHSYETMMYEYKAAWPYLAINGFLLSDDVKMNTAFCEFAKDMSRMTMIYKGRFGIAQKLK
jgi:GT2 family glycosyltransferase